MTSLARQLERLAVPYTQSLLGQDTRRASLLFDPKEAANLDKEAVFALAISGLEELVLIYPAFGDFEATLFNVASATWERSLQSKEVNDQLDETIAKFLVLLSPYFLLRAAHKTLEWLIYKYHIHQFNIDALLLCVLPYHDTNIFVRVVQLLPISKPTDKWNWIDAAAKAGVPLARQTLVNHCLGDCGFFAFICEIVPRFIKCHGADSKQLRAVIALFTCTMLGTLQREENVNERLLSVVVPQLIRGFKCRSDEYRAACLMVLSQLARVARLKESLLVSLLPVVTRRMSSGLATEVLSCLTVICETQTIGTLPKKSFKHISRTPGVVNLLTNLSHKYCIKTLLRLWFDRLILAAVELRGGSTYSSSDGSDGCAQITPDYPNQLQLALSEVAINNDLAKYLAGSLMKKLLERGQEIAPTDADMVCRWQQLTKHVLTTIDHRHPTALEGALEETLARHHNHSLTLSTLQEMMSLTTTPLKYQLLRDSDTCLLLGLSHAQPSTRLLALQKLRSCCQDNQYLPGDVLAPVLLQRISDDSVHVASAALSLRSLLLKTIDKDKLLVSLLNIVNKKHGLARWVPVTTAALEIVCDTAMASVMPDLGMTLLPYILVTRDDAAEIDDAKTILRSSGAGNYEFLKRIAPAWLNEVSSLDGAPSIELVTKLNCILVCGLAGNVSESQRSQLLLWGSAVLGEETPSHKATFLLICALAELLTSTTSRANSRASGSKSRKQDQCLEMCSLLLNALTGLCGKTTQKSKVAIAMPGPTLEEMFSSCLPVMKSSGSVPVSLQLWAAHKITSAVRSFSFLSEGDVWLSGDDESVSVVLRLLDLLMRQACLDTPAANSWRQLLMTDNFDQSMMHRLFPYVWTNDTRRDDQLSTNISAVLYVGSFYLLANRWQHVPGAIDDALQESSAVIPSLLTSLRSHQVAVRRGALKCLRLMRQHCRHVSCVFASVIKRLVTQEEEILADPSHILQVMGKIYSKLDKPGRQKSLEQLLQWTTSADTPPNMKERLLELLSKVPTQHVLPRVLPLGTQLLNTVTTESSPTTTAPCHMNVLRLILARFDSDLSCDLHEGDPSLTFLLEALNTEKAGGDTLQCMAIEQITREFFSSLPEVASQRRLVSCLLSVETNTKCSSVSTAVRTCLKQLKLNGDQISHEIPGTDSTEVATIKGKKRARIGMVVPPVDYRRLTLLLEVLQSRKKVRDSESLVGRLFALLSRCLSEESDEVEYCNQLILSCLFNICSRWTQKPAQEEIFNVEVLVQCIRSSTSPQTQRQALLLMASVAHLLPEFILHNMMSIFTFMGTNLLQQDDSYSFHVITMTMRTIIPALIKAHEGDHSGTLSDQIAGILRVFIDARHHIPKHRSQLLFRQLIDTIDPQRHLWMVMVLMMESAVRSRDVPTVREDSIVDETQKGMSRIDQDIEFMAQICEQFPAAIQMRSCSHVMAFLQKLSHTNEKKSRGSKAKKLDLINVDSLSVQQLRQLQMNMTKLIAVLLSRESFVTQIVLEYDKMADTDTVDEFIAFVRESLCYLTAVTRNQGTRDGVDGRDRGDGRDGVDAAAGKFWKSALHKVYDILDKVNYLLPTYVFLDVVSTLMLHAHVGVRRKALELLNRKLQQLQPTTLSDTEVQSLLMLVEELVTMATVGKPATMATGGSLTGRETDSDVVTVQQLALFSLKLMCKILGAKHPKAFAKVFDISIKILDDSSHASSLPPPPMIASALLCLAELCTTTKAHAIPHLSRFMPPVIATLNNKTLLMGHDLVMICALTALHRITASLPHFLSPYLVDIILAVCHTSSLVNVGDKSRKSPASVRLSGVRHQVASAVAPRVLVPALSACYSKLLVDNQDGLLLLMEILRESVESMTKDDLAAQHNSLVTFFCSVLDLSNAPQLTLGWSETRHVESAAIEAVLAMVVRLSENTFRPIFYKLYDWACREDSPEYRSRTLTFFRLAERLSEQLKSLFNLFIGHVVKTAAILLGQNHSLHEDTPYFGTDKSSTEKTCLLLDHVIGCLHKCMLYDTDGFVNNDVFTLLMQPLVDQLENFIGGDASYEARIRDNVTPCVSQLAIATHDDTAWKSLNYQILLKTRHNLPKVRFAALKTIEDLARKLGDEYMSLVPETIPFLAELMEDESEEVEQLCQQVVASMEDVLGESLQKYF